MSNPNEVTLLCYRCDTDDREMRERDITYPAPRLIQVLPGHPPADPKRRNIVHQYKEGQAYESIET